MTVSNPDPEDVMFDQRTTVLPFRAVLMLGTIVAVVAGCAETDSERPGWRAESEACPSADETCETAPDSPDETDDQPEDEPEEEFEDEDEEVAYCPPRAPRRKWRQMPTLPERVHERECPAFEVSFSGDAHIPIDETVAWNRSDSAIERSVRTADTETLRSRDTFHLEDGSVRRVTHRNPNLAGFEFRAHELIT